MYKLVTPTLPSCRLQLVWGVERVHTCWSRNVATGDSSAGVDVCVFERVHTYLLE